MARRRKPAAPELPFTPFSETHPQTHREVKRDVDPVFSREVIRDAFLEGKDAVAVTMLREMDGREDIKVARKHTLEAERISMNMPPSCTGAIPALVRGFEALAVAGDRLQHIPHEMRAPNSVLFGKRNRAEKKLMDIKQEMAARCTGDRHQQILGSLGKKRSR